MSLEGFWIFSALVHTGLLAATGFEWSGSVSWRKPIVFGLSIGLLLMTVGWILDRLPDRPRLAGTIAWTLGVSSTIEVGLITVQAWRGEASHFNVFGRNQCDDLRADGGDGGHHVALSLRGADLGDCGPTGRPARQLGGDRGDGSGGGWVGYRPVVDPHAIAFHGIQAFIISALALRRSDTSEDGRSRLMKALVASYSALLAFASAQSILGVAPTGTSVWTALMGVSGLATFVVLYRVARLYMTLRSRPRPIGSTCRDSLTSHAMLDANSRIAVNADRLLALVFAIVTQVEIWVFAKSLHSMPTAHKWAVRAASRPLHNARRRRRNWPNHPPGNRHSVWLPVCP